jgi:hypothetical protein
MCSNKRLDRNTRDETSLWSTFHLTGPGFRYRAMKLSILTEGVRAFPQLQ